MKFKSTLYFILLSILLLGCNVTKKVGDNEYLLTKNIIQTDKSDPFDAEAMEYIKQKPNKKMLEVFPMYQWMFNKSDPKLDKVYYDYFNSNNQTKEHLNALLDKYELPEYKDKGYSGWWYKNGEAPVIADTVLAYASAEQIQKFYFSKGYFDNKVTFEQSFGKKESLKKQKKVNFIFKVTKGSAYRIDSITNRIHTNSLDSLLNGEKSARWKVLEKGQRIDVDNLKREQANINEIIRNKGYYFFDKKNVFYRVDTLRDTISIPMNREIENHKIIENQEVKVIDHLPYRIGEINVVTDFSYLNKHKKYTDSINYKGYTIKSHDKFKYRPRAISDAIVFKKGDLYSQKAHDLTYTKFTYLNNFKIPEIVFKKDSLVPQTLNANILLTPTDKYDLDFALDNTFSNYLGYGFSPSLTLVSKNVFGGAENLSIALEGTIGTVEQQDEQGQKVDGFFNAWEVGLEASLTFPRFLLPFNTEHVVPSEISPSSRIALGINQQRNIGLGKVSFNGILDYRWTVNKAHTHSLELLNYKYIRNVGKEDYYKVFAFDGNIRDNIYAIYENYDSQAILDYNEGILGERELSRQILNNESFLANNPVDYTDYVNMLVRKDRITRDNFFSSLIYTYTYDQAKNINYKHPFFARVRFESSGNSLHLLDKIFNFKENATSTSSNRQIFGVDYAQFLRFDLELKKTWKFSKTKQFASRLFTGIILPYGNSDTAPFDKSFYAGGASDIRAWNAYGLGPGTFSSNYQTFPVGDLKVTANLEYRFPIKGPILGAVFVDAGNIWNRGRNVNAEEKFNFNKFYKELAVGTGFGLRYDFDYAIIRFDLAHKVMDPSKSEGKRFVLTKQKLIKDITLQFGINYPF